MDRADRVGRLTEQMMVAGSGGFLVWYVCAKIAACAWGLAAL